MHILQCSNGHYYDGDKYTVCPHCKITVTPEEPATPGKKDESNSVFNRIEEAERQKSERETVPPISVTESVEPEQSVSVPETPLQTVPAEEPLKNESLTDTLPDIQSSPDIQLPENEPEEIIQPVEEDDYYTSPTDPFEFAIPENSSADVLKEEVPETEFFGEEPLDVKSVVTESAIAEPVIEESAIAKPVIEETVIAEPEKATSFVKQEINEEIKRATAADDGKTLGFFRSNAQTLNEPVVGWLVCVKGKHFGECFELKSGRNSVGRNDDNKIVIRDDFSVSGSKHLWIVYEPKKREFFAQPGESSGLSYLNGDNIMVPQKMQAYDRLEFGTGLYVLVPLCNERFSWEDYLN